MAKSKEEKVFSFDDINTEMNKISEYGDVMDKSNISTIDHYIDTGNYHLNACLTGSLFKGYPNNRAVAIAGPSGTGKTYLVLNAIKKAQELGYSIIFYDSENAVDRKLIESFGIDPTKFRYEPCNTVQEFRTSITAITTKMIEQKEKGFKLPKIMVVLDSAGNLATAKEVKDAIDGSEKADMTRAKLLKSTFRILMTRMGICKMPFLFTNHTYQTQDLFSKTVGGGGTGPEYAASIILFLGKAKLKEGKEQVGIIVNAKPNKNRFVKPIPIKFHISYSKGMNPYVGLEEYISWENCGIVKGAEITPAKYNKMTEAEKNKCVIHKYPVIGVGEDKGTEIVRYIQPKDTARKLYVEHLREFVEVNELFTPKVINQSVLEDLEKIVSAKFSYGGDEVTLESLNEILIKENASNEEN